jgi:hypothetical protein
MKRFIRLFALVAVLTFFGQSEVFAQPFKSAVGVRLGYPLSASYKTFLNESNAVEVYAGFRGFTGYNSISVNGAFQIHQDLGATEGLQWYYGGGAGIEFWSYDFIDDSSTFLRLAGYLGLQYTFQDTPISVTADWVPTFIVGDGIGGFGTTGFGAGYGALGVRYVLGE